MNPYERSDKLKSWYIENVPLYFGRKYTIDVETYDRQRSGIFNMGIHNSVGYYCVLNGFGIKDIYSSNENTITGLTEDLCYFEINLGERIVEFYNIEYTIPKHFSNSRRKIVKYDIGLLTYEQAVSKKEELESFEYNKNYSFKVIKLKKDIFQELEETINKLKRG